MQIEEFVPITAASIEQVLRQRFGYSEEGYADQRRTRPRWPFPGTVELWIPDESGEEEYVLARALNLSPKGVAIITEDDLAVGSTVSIAIHQPETTFLGKATVKHRTPMEKGHRVGLEFIL